MKCWKCGQELMDGTSVCIYCGVSQSRPEPATAAGRAMRALYDRYGAQAVLSNGAYLTSGLGDLVGDSKKLRNQLKMAMDAGVGRVYLEQLGAGAPDGDFDRRVKVLLTEDAGLSDKIAAELAVCFDEMIGWRAASQPGTQTGTPPRPQPDSGGYTAPQPQPDSGERYTAPQPKDGGGGPAAPEPRTNSGWRYTAPQPKDGSGGPAAPEPKTNSGWRYTAPQPKDGGGSPAAPEPKTNSGWRYAAPQLQPGGGSPAAPEPGTNSGWRYTALQPQASGGWRYTAPGTKIDRSADKMPDTQWRVASRNSWMYSQFGKKMQKEAFTICVQKDTHVITSLWYSCSMEADKLFYNKAETEYNMAVTDSLEAMAEALGCGEVEVRRHRGGNFFYRHAMNPEGVLRAEQAGVMRFIHLNGKRQPEQFEIIFSRNIDAFMGLLRQWGFKM